MSPKKPKITLIRPSAGINHSGGGEAFAIEMSRQLSQRFEVELLAGPGSCVEAYPLWGGITRSQIRPFTQHPVVAAALGKIATNPDIVLEHLTNFWPCVWRLLTHTPDLIFPCNDYGGLAIGAFVRAMKGTPVLYTQHTGQLASNKPLYRNLKFRPDELVVFSRETARLVQEHRPDQSVSVIENGVNLDRFSPAGPRREHGLNGPVALCVASLSRCDHKRVELTLEAIARVPELSLLICGDGVDREYYQALGEKLLGAERFAICTVSFDDMPQVYRSADLFTLASVDEPFGLSYLEAMATGLPVVTTDDAMRRHIVADAGQVCDVTNPADYAQALQSVLRHKQSHGGEQASRRNATRFSWTTLMPAYEQLILDTIERAALGRTSLAASFGSKLG